MIVLLALGVRNFIRICTNWLVTLSFGLWVCILGEFLTRERQVWRRHLSMLRQVLIKTQLSCKHWWLSAHRVFGDVLSLGLPILSVLSFLFINLISAIGPKISWKYAPFALIVLTFLKSKIQWAWLLILVLISLVAWKLGNHLWLIAFELVLGGVLVEHKAWFVLVIKWLVNFLVLICIIILLDFWQRLIPLRKSSILILVLKTGRKQRILVELPMSYVRCNIFLIGDRRICIFWILYVGIISILVHLVIK